MVRQTSLKAYRDLKPATQENKIVRVLRNRPQGMTRNEISLYSGIRLTSVCGRVHKLLKQSILYEEGQRHCRVTGKLGNVVMWSGY